MLRWLRDRFRRARRQRELRELEEPFFAEVLLDGVAVGVLTDRKPDDMFWRSYRVEAIGDATVIYDDDFWLSAGVTFRSRAGLVCTTGFIGGSPPFVRDGRVRLRAMYFGEAPALPGARALVRKK